MTYDEARAAVILKRQQLADWRAKRDDLQSKAAFANTALELHAGRHGHGGEYGSGPEGKLAEEVRQAERKFAEVCLELAQLPKPKGRRR